MNVSGFKPPSQRQRRLLAKAQTQYATKIGYAAGFLNGRGISVGWAQKWGLGVAASPPPSHERFRDRLCIPYLDKAGVTALKFRCVGEHNCKEEGHAKYDQPAGQTQSLFNIRALDLPTPTLHVCEGELDTLVLSEVLSLLPGMWQPVAVAGVAGVDHWREHWAAHLRDFQRVVLWQQGDQAGRGMGAAWVRKAGVEVVELPEGHDVNSYYVAFGAKAVGHLYEGGDDVAGDD